MTDKNCLIKWPNGSLSYAKEGETILEAAKKAGADAIKLQTYTPDTMTIKCDSKDFAVTDISHSRAVIQIKGSNVKEVLKKGCPINFNEFKKNSCAGSVFNGITIVIDCIEENPQTFNLVTLRSFGESFYHHITDSALEFGYVGV